MFIIFQNLTSCYDNCSEKIIFLSYPKYRKHEVFVDLFCRNDSSLIFDVTIENNKKKKFNTEYLVYLIKVEKHGSRQIFIVSIYTLIKS